MAKNKYLSSSAEMWNLFLAYKKVIKSNPILVQDFVGKDGEEVNRKKERPLTIEGFENYCADQEIISDLGDYFENRNKKYSEYSAICSRIKREIRQNQIEGGMAGIYNPSITQRLNGLTEKIQEDGKKEITINVKRGNRHNTQRPAPGTTEGEG